MVGQFNTFDGYSDSCDAGLNTVSSGRKSNILPAIYLTNCNHILNKLDELYLLAVDNSSDLEIICLSETWLDDLSPDSVLLYMQLKRIVRTELLVKAVVLVLCAP